MIAAALACGFSFHDPKEAYLHTIETVGADGKQAHQVTWALKGGEVVEFRLPNGTTEHIGFLEFARRWKDQDWLLANPEHPIGYLKCAFAQYKALIHAIKQEVPTIVLRQGERKYLIPADAPDEEVAKLMALE
jgi:hypothetical protein